MTRRLGIAHLTALDVAPPAFIRLAAEAGFDAVGLRLVSLGPGHLGWPLHEDRAALRETRAAMADTGLAVADIEFVKVEPQTDVAALEPVFATGAELGAGHLIAAPYDPDLSRLADRLGAMADRASRHGMGVVLEFFPWTVVPDLAGALAVVGRAGRGNLGVLVDTLHFDTSGAPLAEITAVPPALMPFVHVCDAPRDRGRSTEAMLRTAREDRLPPGEGDLPLRDILRLLPPGLPVSLEVPMAETRAAEGALAVATRIARAFRAVDPG